MMHTTISQRNNEKSLHLWWIIGICIIFGTFYGVYIVHSWSEAVEFAQVWAGLITYPKDNPWGQVILADSSLQISLPALLLYWGIDTWPLSLACNAFTCVLAFTAAGILSFALTRQLPISIIAIFALITYNFTDAFGYKIVYPYFMCQFGQNGFYLCIIAFALIACRHYKIGSIIGSSLTAIHPVWWIAYLLGVFPALFFMDRRHFRSVATYTAIASLLWVLLHQLCLWLLPTQEIFPKILSIVETHSAAGLSRPIQFFFGVHNIVIRDSPAPWHLAINMFFPVILFAIFSGIYVLVVRRQTINLTYTKNQLLATSGANVLAMAILPLCCATLYQAVVEFDPHFDLLATIDPRIPNLILRAIINRWFNLAEFMLPLLPLALLAVLTIKHQSFLALCGLVYFIYFMGEPWFMSILYNAHYPETASLEMQPYQLFFMAVVLLALFNRWEPKSHLSQITKLYPKVLWLLCLIVSGQYSIVAWNTAVHSIQKRDAVKFDPLITIAKEEKGPIIYAPFLRRQGVLYQLELNRPYVVEEYVRPGTPYGDLYCYTNPEETRSQWIAHSQTCFEERTKNEWLALAKRTHATALITPKTWRLALTPTITNDHLTYYRLP